MIFITVNSPFYSGKRQFETDKKAEDFLKSIRRLQLFMIKQKALKQFEFVPFVPKTKFYILQDRELRRVFKHAVAGKSKISGDFGLKIQIQNTDAAQLNFHHQLK